MEDKPAEFAHCLASLQVIHDDEPYSDHQIALYVGAWHAMQSCRPIGMDVGPVPWTAIDQWTQRQRLDREAAMLVEYVIRFIEGEHAEAKAATAALDAVRGKRR